MKIVVAYRKWKRGQKAGYIATLKDGRKKLGSGFGKLLSSAIGNCVLNNRKKLGVEVKVTSWQYE